MGYWYYGTEMVMTEKLFKEFMPALIASEYCVMPYQIKKTNNNWYILEWDGIKHYDMCTTNIADQIIYEHSEDEGYGYKLLTEGESDEDYIMKEEYTELDRDNDNIYEFEDFYWEKHEPEEFQVAEEITYEKESEVK